MPATRTVVLAFVVSAGATLSVGAPGRFAGLAARDADVELHLDARCTIVETLPLEALGDHDDEIVRRARANCLAGAGPIAGARLETDWTWRVERRAIEAGPEVWRTADGTLTLPAHGATLRRDADGGWILGARGTVALASGAAARWAGRRYVLAAPLDGVDEDVDVGH